MANHYNPSEIFHSYWVYCLDQELSSTYPNQEGKWMMFFPLGKLLKFPLSLALKMKITIFPEKSKIR
jgi:hypothetical protein